MQVEEIGKACAYNQPQAVFCVNTLSSSKLCLPRELMIFVSCMRSNLRSQLEMTPLLYETYFILWHLQSEELWQNFGMKEYICINSIVLLL